MANPKLLRSFLSSPKRPGGTLTYHGTQGFLFAVMSAPELIPPSEWMHLIFDDEDPSFASDREQSDVFSALVDLFNAGILNGTGALLPTHAIREDPLANLEEDAPLSHWAQGFIRGFWWLEDVWSPFWGQVADDLGDYWLFVLTFFASRGSAEEMLEGVEDPLSLEEAASHIVSALPEVASDFLDFWRRVYEEQVYPAMVGQGGEPVVEDAPSIQADDLGTEGRDSIEASRNAPCDCGSGKPFAECCGREMN
ncbi:MAG: UPF0149 family protein [Gemmatimonadetes bacterium]|nr:UPF0149 family protein [Gemmatimonadota bacterium]